MYRRLADFFQLIRGQSFAVRGAELVDQPFEPLQVTRLHHQPAVFPDFVERQRALADLDAFGQQVLVVADATEMRLLLRQCGQDQRQAAGARVMFENGSVHLAEVAVAVAIDFRLLAAAARFGLHGVASFAGATVALRKTALALVGQLAAQSIREGARYVFMQGNFIQRIAVAAQQPYRVP